MLWHFPTPIVFSMILPWGGRLELLKNKAGYTTCSMRTIRSVPDKRLSLPIIRQVQNLGHPPKYGFSTSVWVILRLVSLSLYFFFLQKGQSSLFIVMFVSLLNNIEQLFFLVLIKVLNLLILFIWMCRDLHLSLIFLV